jgi:hypothetical protein
MTQQRLSLSSMIAAATAVVALGLPGMASAAYEHPANNEKGVIVHPEHFKSEKTRAQVKAEPRLPCGKAAFLMARATTQCLCLMWAQGKLVSK